MGIIRAVAGLPLAPLRGVYWVAEQIETQVDREMNDPGVLRRKIDEAERAYERGEIGEDERDAIQEDALARLTGRTPGVGHG
ncbi:gas vesicle protein GvpG [Pseudonocardia phyllosphaerae]|uniref:gas vesicle protein GvpG n=1 Tax=Pseudonocardia phyllosphaerae TaxID=3390502 RepID=UPI00397E7243